VETEARLRDAEHRVIDFGRMKVELADTLEKLEQSRAQCKQLAETLRHTQPSLTKSKRTLAGEIEVVRSPQRHLQQRILELEAEVDEYRRQIARLQKVEAMNADLFARDGQRRIEELEHENERLKVKINMSDLSNTSLSRKVREAEIKNNGLQRQIFDLQNASAAAFSVGGRINALQEENRRLRNEIADYQTGPLSPSKLTRQNVDLAVQLNTGQIENQSLHRQVARIIDG
jgi:DNA repair exonuclease SbcCD ATPase subunit